MIFLHLLKIFTKIINPEEQDSLKKSSLAGLINAVPTSVGPIDVMQYVQANVKAMSAGVFGI